MKSMLGSIVSLGICAALAGWTGGQTHAQGRWIEAGLDGWCMRKDRAEKGF